MFAFLHRVSNNSMNILQYIFLKSAQALKMKTWLL